MWPHHHPYCTASSTFFTLQIKWGFTRHACIWIGQCANHKSQNHKDRCTFGHTFILSHYSFVIRGVECAVYFIYFLYFYFLWGDIEIYWITCLCHFLFSVSLFFFFLLWYWFPRSLPFLFCSLSLSSSAVWVKLFIFYCWKSKNSTA